MKLFSAFRCQVDHKVSSEKNSCDLFPFQEKGRSVLLEEFKTSILDLNWEGTEILPLVFMYLLPISGGLAARALKAC